MTEPSITMKLYTLWLHSSLWLRIAFSNPAQGSGRNLRFDRSGSSAGGPFSGEPGIFGPVPIKVWMVRSYPTGIIAPDREPEDSFFFGLTPVPVASTGHLSTDGLRPVGRGCRYPSICLRSVVPLRDLCPQLP